MENKFKIGDKVVCGDPAFEGTYGLVGEVIDLPGSFSDLYLVECNGSELGYYERELTAAPNVVEPPKPEWDGVFRVGDKGLTRGDRSYEIISVTSPGDYCGTPQPVIARREDGSERAYTADGLFFKAGETSVHDLMPPTERGPVVVGVDVTADANVAVDVPANAFVEIATGAFVTPTITVPTEQGDVKMDGAAVAALMRRVHELEEVLAASQRRIDELVAERGGWTVEHVGLVTLAPGEEATFGIDASVDVVIADLEGDRTMSLSAYESLLSAIKGE